MPSVSSPPFPVSPPPPPPNQSALHLLSLRACHPYGISEAGARHPLPLSLSSSSSSRPSLHAPISAPTLPRSSLKGPGGILPCSLLGVRTENKEARRRGQKKKTPRKTRIYSFPHPAWSLLCFLCPQAWCWFVVVVIVVVVDFHASPSSGWLLQFEQKEVNPLGTLELSWLWCY